MSKAIIQTRHRGQMLPFLLALGFLQLSQLYVYPPGSDVSPWAGASGQLHALTFGGASLQTWAFALLAAICLIGALAKVKGPTSYQSLIWIGIAWVTLTAAIMANSVTEYLDGVGKIVLPVLVYLYLSPRANADRELSATILVWINGFTLLQVLLSKALTGRFAANLYYHELSEEYFGYYHHPFAMTGVLVFCSIIAFYRLLQGNARFMNATFLALNTWLILNSQVRTYIVALGVGLTLATLALFMRRGRALWLVVLSPFFVISAFALDGLGMAGERVTADASSGRLERWIIDIEAFTSTATTSSLLFGGGPGHVNDLNLELFGVWINSLNVFIDIFVDYGILGLTAFIAVWIIILLDAKRLTGTSLVLVLTSTMLVASALSNAFDFPNISVVFAIALTALRRQEGLDPIANTCATPTAVSRGSGKQRLVG